MHRQWDTLPAELKEQYGDKFFKAGKTLKLIHDNKGIDTQNLSHFQIHFINWKVYLNSFIPQQQNNYTIV